MTTETSPEYENSSLFASNSLYAPLEKEDICFKFVYVKNKKVESACEILEGLK